MMKQKTTGHRRIPSRLLGVSLLLAGMSLVPVSGPVWAREGATAATFGLVDEAPHTFLRPKQVSLFPTHALVQGEEELEVRVRDGVGGRPHAGSAGCRCLSRTYRLQFLVPLGNRHTYYI